MMYVLRILEIISACFKFFFVLLLVFLLEKKESFFPSGP